MFNRSTMITMISINETKCQPEMSQKKTVHSRGFHRITYLHTGAPNAKVWGGEGSEKEFDSLFLLDDLITIETDWEPENSSKKQHNILGHAYDFSF